MHTWKQHRMIVISISVGIAALALLLVVMGAAGPLNTASASEPVRPPARPLAVAPGDVLINEFVVKESAGSEGGEWVELYNTTASAVDITGWQLETDQVYTLTGSVPISGYLVITDTNVNVGNSGGTIRLISGTVTIDEVAFGNQGEAPLSCDEYSTARVPNAQDTDNDACDWNLDASPTPGFANDAPGVNLGSSLVFNEFDNYPASGNDKVEVYNPTASDIVIENWLLSDGDGVAMVTGPITVTVGGWQVLEEYVDWVPGGSSGVDFSSHDVAYLFQPDGTRVDQIGWDGEYENNTFQRIPDGAGPNDGYDWTSSGGDVTWFDLPETLGYTNIRSLNISKNGPAAVLEGDVASFTITYGNMAGDTAQSVVITEALPAGVEYSGFITYTTDLTLTSTTPPAWDAGDVLSNTTGLTFTVWVTYTGPFSNRQVVDNVVWIDSPTAGFNPVSGTLSTVVLTGTTSIHDIQYVDQSVGGTFPSDLLGQMAYVEGVVIAESCEVDNADTYVIEDPAGGSWSGLRVYTYGDQPSVNEGDYVRLIGRVDEYYGMTQFNVGNGVGGKQTVISTTNPLPAPEVIATNDFATGNAYNAEAYESVLIEFQDATVTDESLGYGEWEFDDGSGPTRADDAGNEDGDQTYVPELGDVYDFIRGIGWWSYSNYKLQPRYNADIGLQVAGPAIIKDAPALVAPGELFTYTITVENELGFTLDDVVITDVVPANTTFAYALGGGGASGGVISWTVVSLPHLGSATVRFVVTATGSITTITNADYAVVASNFSTPTAGASVVTIVDTQLRIRHIQGASHVSPLVDQDVQDVHGIVTAKRSKGFYMQDPNPDSDDATSEAIFVYTISAPTVNVGDEVLVSGTVAEFRYKAAHLSMTRIEEPTVVVSSTGNPLPAATVIGTGGRIPPQQVIDDDALSVFDPATDGIDFYESLEAMLVQVNDAIVVGPTSYGVIPVVGDNGANVGLLTPRGGIVVQADDFNPERILVDEAIIGYNTAPSVNVGASFTGPITGVIDYNDYDGNFNLLNVNPLPATSGGVVSETTTAPTADQLSVASFNVYNLDPGDSVTRCAGLAGQIVNNLQSPDIIGLQEIQDNSGTTDNGIVDATATYTTLIAAIQAAGGPTYDFCDISPEDGKDGGVPGGNIRVGFLFRTDRGLTFVDRPGAVATTAVTVTMGATGVELSHSPGRIDPANSAFNDSRKPLVGEFLFNGRKMFVVVNHFNSKGGDDALFGRTQPPVLYSEVQRLQQAQVVNDFVDSILALDANANVIVLGDLNDFQFSTPVSDTLAADVLTNLVSTLPITEQYTYLYVGNSQVLDHILVSDNLFKNASIEFDVVHVNAEFAYSSSRPSDHDPVVATFTLLRRVYLPLVIRNF